MRPAPAAALNLRSILETDRVWTAYALADLQPPWDQHTSWIPGERSTLMVFDRLDPPLLFAHGEPAELEQLAEQLPAGEYWYTLRPTDHARLAGRLRDRMRSRMWRMWLAPDASGEAGRASSPSRSAAGEVDVADQPTASVKVAKQSSPVRLESSQLAELEAFFGRLTDGPDAFVSEQLDEGIYYGMRVAGKLASVAGTHVACQPYGVAAIGNVATLPEQRGQGLARAVTRAVVGELLRRGFVTIVLNVRMDNQPAIQLYRRLGFMPYCGFYEGRTVVV